MARFTVDLTPLRKNRNLRYIFISGVVTRFGSALTLVALPFQIKELTDSYIAVGAMGAVEIIPLIIFALWGGVLADSVDRKKMVWRCEAGALFFSATLLGNSLLHHPHLFVLYIVAAGFAASDGLQGPSFTAMIPRLVDHEDLPAAMALMSLRWQFSAIIGPALAGVIIATSGVKTAYGIDIITYVLSVAMILRVASIPPIKDGTSKSIKAMFGGLHYAASRKDLMGTYIIDLAAMFFAMPNALFPFWGRSNPLPLGSRSLLFLRHHWINFRNSNKWMDEALHQTWSRNHHRCHRLGCLHRSCGLHQFSLGSTALSRTCRGI